MKPTLLLLTALLLTGCLAPKDSGVKVKNWEYPVSPVMLPIDSIICAGFKFDEAKANKGDAEAAMRLAQDHLNYGSGRSYFEHQSEKWYIKAQELEHPKAEKTYEQWRRDYKPPEPPKNNRYQNHNYDYLLPLIDLIPYFF